MTRFFPLVLLLFAASAAGAFELSLPSTARQTLDSVTDPDVYHMPTGPYREGAVPSVKLEGRVDRRAWRIDSQDLTTLQILQPLRDTLQAAGYKTFLECADRECGGFDFRFETEVLPAPEMYVSLTDFIFLGSKKSDADQLSLLVSRSGNAGYIQMIRVTKNDVGVPVDPISFRSISSVFQSKQGIEERLLTQGHIVLDDLEFSTGSADLGARDFASLMELAKILKSAPDMRVALVGHTDAVGKLESNIALSKRRANSVLERLVNTYEVPSDQVVADGIGFLSPRAPNDTDQGREANRRVEVVLLNTE